MSPETGAPPPGDDDTPSQRDDTLPRRESPWPQLLKGLGEKLLPVIVSTGSLVTFVAFAGAVIVWTRLNAVEVAPDQAIVAFPRGELVSIGASLLLLFGFFGALAVLAVFLVDRGGRPTQGMAYWLLAVLTAEGVVAITTATDFGTREWSIAILLFLLPIGFAGWATRLGLFSELRDELPGRPLETRGPLRRRSDRLRPPPGGGRPPQESSTPLCKLLIWVRKPLDGWARRSTRGGRSACGDGSRGVVTKPPL